MLENTPFFFHIFWNVSINAPGGLQNSSTINIVNIHKSLLEVVEICITPFKYHPRNKSKDTYFHFQISDFRVPNIMAILLFTNKRITFTYLLIFLTILHSVESFQCRSRMGLIYLPISGGHSLFCP